MLPFLEAAFAFEAACEAAGVGRFLGGSAASALQGEPRMTNDLDFVIDAKPRQIDGLVDALGDAFEADRDALRRAARSRRSWNVFYLPDFTKIDVFFLGETPFDRSEFERREPVTVAADRPPLTMKTPEDSVVRKLLWFRAGGEVSQKHWRDVVGLLLANPKLDQAYVDAWAAKLGLVELLMKAKAAAGLN